MAKRCKQIRRGRAIWKKIVEEFAESGESQSEFARQKGLKQTTLCRWVRQLGPKKETALIRSELIEIVPSPPEHMQMTSGPTRLSIGAATLEFSELPPVQYMSSLLREVGSC